MDASRRSDAIDAAGACAALVGVVALYDLARHALSRARWQRLRPLDHGLKMIGFHAAMASAGLGNLLTFAQPWSSVAPIVLGTAGMLYVACLHAIGRRALRIGVRPGLESRSCGPLAAALRRDSKRGQTPPADSWSRPQASAACRVARALRPSAPTMPRPSSTRAALLVSGTALIVPLTNASLYST